MASQAPPKDQAAHAVSGAEFKPYVPASEERRELSARALIIGSIFGILFGASTVYLGLKVGITVSASIPVAVLSIPIFRALGRGSILENNMTQTIASAGESIAAGAAFTLPALLVMGYDLEIGRSTLVALTGGWLGVMLMIPLRRSLIVREHGVLPYPEGTACAEVLEAGEKRGVQARLVFIGVAVGMVYKLLYKTFGFWREIPGKVFGGTLKSGSVAMEASPELLGVGYIIGPRIAGVMMAGGVLSFLVLIPMIHYFVGEFGSDALRAQWETMTPGQIRNNYVLLVGVGAVAAGGLISLGRALPTIVRTFGAAMKGLGAAGTSASGQGVPRTEQDLPVTVTIGGALLIALVVAVMPQLDVNPLAAVLIVIFGFFFATVSSRICGQIGSSSNPISGMTIATLLLTSVIFVAVGWSGAEYRPIALTVGAIVCVAAANAGATSQDLKTGFLVGATPRRQQIGLLVGVTAAALVVGWTLYFINTAYTTVEPLAMPRVTLPAAEDAMPLAGRSLPIASDPKGGAAGGSVTLDAEGRIVEWHVDGVPADAPRMKAPDGKEYARVKFAGDRQLGVPEGRLLVDEAGVARFAVSPGINVGGVQAFVNATPENKFDAPKAQMMALIIDGILERKLEWALVLFGVFIALCLELAGIEALPFAVGLYLPISSSAPIFAGGTLRWLVGRIARRRAGGKATDEGDTGRGVLLSSGLIAGGALCGLVAAGLAVKVGGAEELFVPARVGGTFASIAESNWLSLIVFGLLCAFVVRMALGKRAE